MHFLDINTFYAETAGGIKTYHRAKLGYFLRHPEHTYTLIAPGPEFNITELADNVRVIHIYGPRLSRDEGGYRLLLDFPSVYRLLKNLQPDVLEVGDPWLSGLFSLFMRKSGAFNGLLASFHHSDAVHAWLQPWAASGKTARPHRTWIARLLARGFYNIQGRYDVTLVSSRFMERHLTRWGVKNVIRKSFGTDPLFINGKKPASHGDHVRLLYAGRLGVEKGTALLLSQLDSILEQPNVTLTVLGRGKFEREFSTFKHPRYTFGGYVSDRTELARIYREHDVFLAPGPHETFGLGVLEALGTGLVVVGPDCGGTAELLNEAEMPFVFRANDAEDFTRAIRDAVETPLPRYTRRAREAAARYGEWDAAIGRMVQFYEARLTEDGAYVTPEPAHVALAS